MDTSLRNNAVQPNLSLGDLMRFWRQKRSKSQLNLSLDTGISQRHLSFVESGRSSPSRDLLLVLFEALDIPFRERNLLLTASGYAPHYAERSLAGEEMTVVDRAIERMLLKHEPYPAIVLDRHWNVVRTNEAAPRLFGSFVNLESRTHPRNILDLMFDPLGMRPFIEDWETVAGGLLQRVNREAVGQVLDPGLQELLKRLRAYPGVSQIKSPPVSQSPVLPITFRRGSEKLSYFSLITTVGMPQCVTAEELRIECMFPCD